MQRPAKVGAPGLVNFITVVAYHIYPSFPAALTQPGESTSADVCTSENGKVLLQVLVQDTFSILLEERTGKEHYLQQQMTKRGTHGTVLSVFFGLKVASTM